MNFFNIIMLFQALFMIAFLCAVRGVGAFRVYRPYRGTLDSEDIMGWRIKGSVKDLTPTKNKNKPLPNNSSSVVVNNNPNPPIWKVQDLMFYEDATCSEGIIVDNSDENNFPYIFSDNDAGSHNWNNATSLFQAGKISTSTTTTTMDITITSYWIGFLNMNANSVLNQMRCVKLVQIDDTYGYFMPTLTIQAYTHQVNEQQSITRNKWRDVYVIKDLEEHDINIDLGTPCYKDYAYATSGRCDGNDGSDGSDDNLYFDERCQWGGNDCHPHNNNDRHDENSQESSNDRWNGMSGLLTFTPLLLFLAAFKYKVRMRNRRVSTLIGEVPATEKDRVDFLLNNIRLGQSVDVSKHVLFQGNECEPIEGGGGERFMDDGDVYSNSISSIMRESESESESKEQDFCSICFEMYKQGDEIAWSKNKACHHAYHAKCILLWLMNHDDCPTCRANFILAPTASTPRTSA